MKINIKVYPKARQEKVVKEGDTYKVYVNSPPVDGKANKRVIELLAKKFKIKKSQISIIKGETSRGKVVEIDGIV